MTKKKFKITGMHCTSCAMNIDGDLEDNVKGVKSASTSYAKQVTEIEYEEDNVKLEQIVKQIEETGYKAELLQE